MSEHRGSGAGRGTDLEIDVLNVVFDGASRQHQPFSDFGVGQAAGDQPQYLHLAFSEVCWASAPDSVRETGRLDDGRSSVGVKPASPSLGLQPICGSRRNEGSPVGTVLDPSSVGVSTGQDPRRHCELGCE